MWPIVKKELRENAPYLIAACVIILLFLDNAALKSGWILFGFQRLLATESELAQFPGYAGNHGACFSDISDTWTIFCFLLAPVIALAQVYRQSLGKTWPLLAHLPIPRSRMILAKVLAGLLMYLMLLLPPVLLVIVRLSTAGVWPGPFHSSMFFPILGYFLAGAMSYLAVFLVALRPARWYATKWLPAFAAIPAWYAAACFVTSLSYPDYWRDLNFMNTRRFFLVALATAVLSLAFVSWAIREQARTREF